MKQIYSSQNFSEAHLLYLAAIFFIENAEIVIRGNLVRVMVPETAQQQSVEQLLAHYKAIGV